MANYNNYIYDVFTGRVSDDFYELIDDILDRFNFDDYLDREPYELYDVLIEDIDSSFFIYDAYQWAMMMYYQSPTEASFNDAFSLFVDDMGTLINSIVDDMVDD